MGSTVTTEKKNNFSDQRSKVTTGQKINVGQQQRSNVTTEQKINVGQQQRSNVTTEQKINVGQQERSNVTAEQKNNVGQQWSNVISQLRINFEQQRINVTTEPENVGQQRSSVTTRQNINVRQQRGNVTTEQNNNVGQQWSSVISQLKINYEQQWSNVTTEQEKCYDPQDTSLLFVEEDDVLDFLCNDFKSLRAKMSCGHAVTPMSLTDWCCYLLDKGKSRFVCGQTDCDVEWPFEEVCKMALLTPKEKVDFEKKVFNNAAKDYLDIKECPGCKSRVIRNDLDDLSVVCPVCTVEKQMAYVFCWQCLREWKGPIPGSDHCGNEDCPNAVEILKNCPDIKFMDVEGVSGCPSIRACPTCGILVEHNKTKCKNVVCFRCKYQFCFVCLKLTEECQEQESYDYYGPCSTGVAPRQTSIPVWYRT